MQEMPVQEVEVSARSVQNQSRDVAPTEVARRKEKLPPVMSEALDTPRGGLQGLAWFWTAFVCDEWGTVANDLLVPTQQGLKRSQGSKIALQNLAYSCAYGVVDVRIEAPKAPDPSKPSTSSTRKRPTKHKKRNRGR